MTNVARPDEAKRLPEKSGQIVQRHKREFAGDRQGGSELLKITLMVII